MSDAASLCLFAAEPLDRAAARRSDPAWLAENLRSPDAVIVPLCAGDPFLRDGALVTLAGPAVPEGAAPVFLGLGGERAYFAFDAPQSVAGQGPTPLREAAAILDPEALAIVGQARWLLDWRARNPHCALCGVKTLIAEGGAKRTCPACGGEHFPRTDPVAIVLAVHDGACLLGRSPRFPPAFVSALAGFVEAAETPEACAIRELKEEAGVDIVDPRYQFSQPWPFPSSLMMGFIATARSRALTLDKNEIEDARWIDKDEIRALLAGARREDLRLPPRFTIARRLIERFAQS